MKNMLIRRIQQCHAFSVAELMIASSIYITVVGSIMVGFTVMQKGLYLGQDYATARLTLSDYLNMDLRRSTRFEPTLTKDVDHGGWRCDDWTLPLVMTVPDYYASDGKTPTAPARQNLTATEYEDRKEIAVTRGRPVPLPWKIVYGDPTKTRMIVYQQIGRDVTRQEGYGSFTRNVTTGVLTWTWTGTEPNIVPVASGVITVSGVYQVKSDLTPEDLTELPPDSATVGLRANYNITYVRSTFSQANPQPSSILLNNVLMRCQYYGL